MSPSMTKTFSSTTDRYDLRLTEGTSRPITSNPAISLLLSCCFVVDLGSDHEVRSRYRLCSLARLSLVRDRNKDVNRQLRTFHTKCARSPLLPVDSWLALEFVFVSKRPTTPEVLARTTDTFPRRPTSSSSDFGSHQSKEPLPPTIEANPDTSHQMRTRITNPLFDLPKNTCCVHFTNSFLNTNAHAR